MTPGEAFAWWLTAWSEKTAWQHAASFGAGLLGGCVATVLNSPSVVLPKRDKAQGTVELGCVGVLLVACVAALAVDIAVPIGIAVGALAPTALRQVSRVLLPGLARLILVWAGDRVKVHDGEGDGRDD